MIFFHNFNHHHIKTTTNINYNYLSSFVPSKTSPETMSQFGNVLYVSNTVGIDVHNGIFSNDEFGKQGAFKLFRSHVLEGLSLGMAGDLSYITMHRIVLNTEIIPDDPNIPCLENGLDYVEKLNANDPFKILYEKNCDRIDKKERRQTRIYEADYDSSDEEKNE
jgi:hypothetical protein